MTETLMSIAEAAQEFDLTRHTISTACQRKQIEGARKVGHQWVIPRAAFLTWLATRKKPGRPRKTKP